MAITVEVRGGAGDVGHDRVTLVDGEDDVCLQLVGLRWVALGPGISTEWYRASTSRPGAALGARRSRMVQHAGDLIDRVRTVDSRAQGAGEGILAGREPVGGERDPRRRGSAVVPLGCSWPS